MTHIFTQKLFSTHVHCLIKLTSIWKSSQLTQVFKQHNLHFKYSELKLTFLQFRLVPSGRKLTQSYALSLFPSVIKFLTYSLISTKCNEGKTAVTPRPVLLQQALKKPALFLLSLPPKAGKSFKVATAVTISREQQICFIRSLFPRSTLTSHPQLRNSPGPVLLLLKAAKSSFACNVEKPLTGSGWSSYLSMNYISRVKIPALWTLNFHFPAGAVFTLRVWKLSSFISASECPTLDNNIGTVKEHHQFKTIFRKYFWKHHDRQNSHIKYLLTKNLSQS